MEAGVLFADLRGFSALSESLGASHAGGTLRRFYALAEQVLLPHALIDKVVGDEVMALYVPMLLRPTRDGSPDDDRRRVATRMLAHAHELLHRAGYGTAGGPTLPMGLGLDFGEVFLGNIGDSAIRDFTAVGEVVNTASRLQAEAAGGEVLVSARLAAHLDTAPGEPEELQLRGRREPLLAHRVRWFTDPG
jgi:adenylate cyclase